MIRSSIMAEMDDGMAEPSFGRRNHAADRLVEPRSSSIGIVQHGRVQVSAMQLPTRVSVVFHVRSRLYNETGTVARQLANTNCLCQLFHEENTRDPPKVHDSPPEKSVSGPITQTRARR
jgi:hypothetical protein